MGELIKNKLGLQVLTDKGWSDFAAIAIKGRQATVSVKTDSRSIRSTSDHKFFSSGLEMVSAEVLTGRNVSTLSGVEKVLSVESHCPELVYDLVNVEKNNRFYANGFLVSNCEFILVEETLISPLKLTTLEGVEPRTTEGQIRWYEDISPDKTYLVALDPSIGTGGDPAAIQVVSLPDYKQVAEWTHNKTAIEKQVDILAGITQKLDDITGNSNKVYFSVENNTIGEAALVAIRNFGEENIAGTFLSEPIKVGSGRKHRKGLNTSNQSKLSACSQLKHLVEHDKMKISSKALISELKTFIAIGNTYQAKIGDTDDLVMSMLCVVRMINILKNYLPNIDEEELDEDDLPMPFFSITF